MSEIALAGTSYSAGTQLSALATQWMATIPPPETSPEYGAALRKFEQMLYCRRCASFTADGSPLSVGEAVTEAFGLDYLFEVSFRYPQEAFGEIIEANLTRAWSVFSERKVFADPQTARLALDRAVANLPAKGFGNGELLNSINAGGRGEIAIYVFEFGNPDRVKAGGYLLGKNHLPGYMILGAAMVGSQPRLEVAGVFYVPGTPTNIGMKNWYRSRAEAIYEAAGLR